MKRTPLLLLHGYPFDHTMWDQVIAQSNLDLIAPDLRGFDADAIPTGEEPSLDRIADDMARLLEARQVPQAVVVGFSMGGYAALAFAERHANRLAGLALINSHPLSDTVEARAGRRAMIEKVRREGVQVAAEAAIPKLFAASNPRKEELARFARRATERAGVKGIAWALEAMARRPDRSAVLEGLTVPVLLIHSTEDQFIPIERAHALAERIRGTLSVEIARTGHCTPLEAPELVAKALAELSARVEAQET